jgi:hypothetical protein
MESYCSGADWANSPQTRDGGIIRFVKASNTPTPHPGPFRITKASPGFAGILLAIGFVVMGVIALPIAKWFLLGVLAVGGAIAFILHLANR